MINSRSINDLHPYVKAQFMKADKELKAMGIEVLVVSTLRDQEYQSKLYAQGRTDKAKPIVTNAKLIGAHGYGLALDLVPMVDGKCAWGRSDLYDKISVVMKKNGFAWGGDWKSFIDKPHFEMMGGLKAEDLRKGMMPKFTDDKTDFDRGLAFMKLKGIITDVHYWQLSSVKGKFIAGEYMRAIIERIGRL
jgi:hypothetical protein